MSKIVLDDIPVRLDPEVLVKLLKVDSGRERDFYKIAEEAADLARPKAVYKPAFISSRGDDWIECDDVRLESRVLAVNVEKAHRVFPFVATSGRELDEWSEGQSDKLLGYWADSLSGFALLSALNAVERHIMDHYGTGMISKMNPGSLEDWPLGEQASLFSILGETVSSIGVELKDSNFMRPRHTVSGIWFSTEVKFESCMLCPMDLCPGRRAPFNKGLFANKYGRERKE